MLRPGRKQRDEGPEGQVGEKQLCPVGLGSEWRKDCRLKGPSTSMEKQNRRQKSETPFPCAKNQRGQRHHRVSQTALRLPMPLSCCLQLCSRGPTGFGHTEGGVRQSGRYRSRVSTYRHNPQHSGSAVTREGAMQETAREASSAPQNPWTSAPPRPEEDLHSFTISTVNTVAPNNRWCRDSSWIRTIFKPQSP